MPNFRRGAASLSHPDPVGPTVYSKSAIGHLAFYRLFRGVDQNLAVQVVIFGGIMPGMFYFISVVGDIAALAIARGIDSLSAFSMAQRDALAMFQRIAAADPSKGLFGSTPLYSKMRTSGYFAAELKATVTAFPSAGDEAIFGA